MKKFYLKSLFQSQILTYLIRFNERMKYKTKSETGKKGEKIAAVYLKKSGYKIKELNFRCPLGELDIVASENKVIVFVEVKTRYSQELGYPEEAVSVKKQKKLSQLALWYMQNKKLTDASARFDVVAVTLHPDKKEIKLIKNAFAFIES
jgi:putative endonuclease